MATKDPADYDVYSLEDLRDECRRRGMEINPKDGVRNLASKLRVNDGDHGEEVTDPGRGDGLKIDVDLERFEELKINEEISEPIRSFDEVIGGKGETKWTFQQKIELLHLERELMKEQQEMERLREREREERDIRREERQRTIRLEEREYEREQDENILQHTLNKQENQGSIRFIRMREMREKEDIDDYFRIFEMTAKAQLIPVEEWLGSLVSRLTEKAKDLYLEIQEVEAQDFYKSKEIILKAYQRTVDYYRYQFKHSEKGSNEDFVQWAHRTRRYLDRWMTVAKAETKNDVLEQVTMERMLEAVSPDLRVWLKEREIETVEKLATKANEYVQARKGPIIDGKYVYNRSMSYEKGKQGGIESIESGNLERGKNDLRKTSGEKDMSKIECYNCHEKGHYASWCKKVKDNIGQIGKALLCMKPLDDGVSFFGPTVVGEINGGLVNMVVDSGCTRTLVHRKFVPISQDIDEKITIMMANGERVIVPLARVEIKSKQGTYVELVGVMRNLPVDCLLGRSSYGRTLQRDDLIEHWEKVTNLGRLAGRYDSRELDEAFVTTRGQALRQKALARSEKLIERENHMRARHLVTKELKKGDNGRAEISLRKLFDENELVTDALRAEGKLGGENTVEYVDGKEDQSINCNILDRNRGQLLLDQQTDVTLAKIGTGGITEGVPLKNKGYYFDKGLMMHRRKMGDDQSGIEVVDRVVVPESFRPEILRLGHDVPLAGHMGQEKTRERIGAHFFWPKFHEDISNYCATCPECQLVARKRTANRLPLAPVPVVSEPFRKIAIDLIGELPATKTGYKYILTVVDYATRYPEAFPLRKTHSKAIADALISLFVRVDIPQEIVSDQGANLISKLMSQLYEELGIINIKTSVYNPQANGLVERFNGTLKTMLRKFAGDSVTDWDKYLPYLLFAYREVPCPTTGYSPFELLYGGTVRGPLAVVKEFWLGKTSSEENLVTHVIGIRKRMAGMRELVRKNVEKAQAKQKCLYDKKSSKRSFKVGDKVLVLLPTPGSKLETKWFGPYVVTQVKNNGRSYELDVGKTKKQRRTYNINLLSRWQTREEAAMLVIPNGVRGELLPHEVNLPMVDGKESWRDVVISSNLDSLQRIEVEALLKKYNDVFSGIPNRTHVISHQINTGNSPPIRTRPYQIPQRLEEVVKV